MNYGNMKRAVSILGLLLLIVSCQGPTGDGFGGKDDWLMFRGNPSLNGYVESTLPDRPVLMWEYRHGVRCVAAPLVQDTCVYLCDKHGVMLGIGLQGKEVFRHDWQTDIEASWLMMDSVMYVGQIDGQVRAVVRSSGKELWSVHTEGQISASPNWIDIDGCAKIVAGSYDGNLYVMDAKTGQVQNQISTGYYVNGAAAVCGDYVVFGGCDAWLRVVDCRTCVATDSMQLDAYIPASPAVTGADVYVADYSGNVWELQLKEGKIVASRKLLQPTDDEGGMLSMPAVTDDAVYVLAETRYLYCLGREDGTVRWRTMLSGEVGECSPLVCKDKVLVCTKSGHISIHNAESGKLLWEYETGEQIIASPAISSGRFYVLTARGTLLCFGGI